MSSVAQETKIELISPIDGATSINDKRIGIEESEKIRAVLRWAASDGVDEYEFDLATVPNGFGNSLGLTRGTSVVVGTSSDAAWCCFDHGTTLYWRVRPVVGNTIQPWSDVWSFTFSQIEHPTSRDLELLQSGFGVPDTVSPKYYFSDDISDHTKKIIQASISDAARIVGNYGISFFGVGDSVNNEMLLAYCELDNDFREPPVDCDSVNLDTFEGTRGLRDYIGTSNANAGFRGAGVRDTGKPRPGMPIVMGLPVQEELEGRKSYDINRETVAIHEYLHIHQIKKTLTSTTLNAKDFRWYNEGGADYFSVALAEGLNYESCDEGDCRGRQTLKTFMRNNYIEYYNSGKDLSAWMASSADSYAIYAWAIGFLVKNHGLQKVFMTYYDWQANELGKSAEQHFFEVFGLTYEKFLNNFFEFMSGDLEQMLTIFDGVPTLILDLKVPTVPSMPKVLTIEEALQFSWEPINMYSRFGLEVSEVSDFSLLLFSQLGINGTSFSPPLNFSSDKKYFVRLNHANGTGISEWSPTVEFTTPASQFIGINTSANFTEDILTIPSLVADDQAYMITMNLLTATPNILFKLTGASKIEKPLTISSMFDLSTGQLTVPNLKIAEKTYTLNFLLTNDLLATFTLVDFVEN